MIATLPFDVTDPITTLALDLSWLSGIDASLHSFIRSFILSRRRVCGMTTRVRR
jgi:hypothetical protein